MLWDHDAAPLTLFEVDELVALAKSSCLQYRFAYKSIGAILCTELSSTANAGIVFFPRLSPEVHDPNLFEEPARFLDMLVHSIQV